LVAATGATMAQLRRAAFAECPAITLIATIRTLADG
jgi:hypothetical protein